ncbi:hypothetical protein P886_0040 [Alteromonadaceae bacterium 2753L.S.0a.02]|nr:hypothetical protein P886_0040 [Alteromonadaceae bacterium 2753L.S.0a.02]
MDIAARLAAIWLIMLVAGFANGAMRDRFMAPALGKRVALPISGITLSLMVFVIIHFSVAGFGAMVTGGWLLLGTVWVLITLVFEVVYTLRKGVALFAVFSVHRGNFFVLVLLVTLVTPLICAHWQGLVSAT